MKKKLLSLALALTLALSLVPAAFAAGQFTDVPDTSPFASAIAWAVGEGITNGTSATTFSPGNPCTVSHILTFLWRGNGRPGDTGDERAAVAAWAAGLGMDATDLGATCTRATAVYNMWLAAGKPEPAQAVSFSDVPASAAYAKAVSWAVEKGVTNGTGADTFSPGNPCTRGHVAAFLYRAAGSPAASTPVVPAAPSTPSGGQVLKDGYWSSTYTTDGTEYTDCFLFSGSGYTLGTLAEEQDGTMLGFYEEGTYRLSGGRIYFTLTRNVGYMRGTPVDLELEPYDWSISQEGGKLVMNTHEYQFMNQANGKSGMDKLKDLVLGGASQSGAVTRDALLSGVWGGENKGESVTYLEYYKFESDGRFSCAYGIADGSVDVYGFEEGTYTLSGNNLTLNTTSNKLLHQGSVDTKTEASSNSYPVSLNGGVLKMNEYTYTADARAASEYARIKGLIDSAPARSQGQTLDGYWTSTYTISGTEYTDIFYFNGSSYAEGTMTETPDGGSVFIYEEGTYRMDGGRIYFTNTLNRGWMQGRSVALDLKAYDWTVSQNGNTLVMNTHTYVHLSDPAQARDILNRTRSLVGAR